MPYFQFPSIGVEEAASHIPSGATVAFSGFSSAGAAKVVPRALANRTWPLWFRARESGLKPR